MKIGMILDQTFPPDPRVENEAIALINSRHEVFLFCLAYADELSEEEIKGIKVRRYKSNKLTYKLSATSYDLPFYRLLMKKKINHFIQSTKIETLHIHDIRIAETVFSVNKKFNLPIVLDLHDNIPDNMKYYPHLNKFPGKYIISPKRWKIKEELFIEKSDKVITVSPEFVNQIVDRTKINSNKIHLVPNTVRKDFYENYLEEKSILEKYKSTFTLLYLGDTNVRRGLLTAIEAIKLLQEKIENIKLVIVGTNTTDFILKQKVDELELQNFVDFEGWQDVSLFPSYILASDVCISPLYRSVQHDVAYANKIFQYMSFAKPLLVSNAKAQKKLVEENNTGKVHKEKDAQDFADKILEFFENPKKMKEMGENGKKFIENTFSWEHTSKELLKLYNDLKN